MIINWSRLLIWELVIYTNDAILIMVMRRQKEIPPIPPPHFLFPPTAPSTAACSAKLVTLNAPSWSLPTRKLSGGPR